jgi:hypothetical protein
MPVTNILKSVGVVLFGAVVGYSSIKYFSGPNENNRGLASMTYSKLGSEQFAKTLFDIKIKNEDLADKGSDISVVRVTIEPYKSLPSSLSYTWNLPDTATLIEGDLSGSLADLAPNQKKEFVIKVHGYSHEVRSYISFTVKGVLEDKAIERDVMVSSRPEDSFEYVVQEHEKARAIQKNSLNKLGKPEVKSPIDLNKVSF